MTIFVFSITFFGWLNYAQEEKSVTLLPWREFIRKIKQLAGSSATARNGTDEKIKHFEKAEELTNEYTTGVLSDGEFPVYGWFDTEKETLYYFTLADKIYMNSDAQSMFRGLSRLESLDLSNFDTSSVTGMNQMFNGCKSLTTLDLSNFDTSNVKTMQWMFNGCNKLENLDLQWDNFDTSKVTDMSSMFYNCQSLADLDLKNFDTSSVKNMQSMFYGCKSLISLDVSSFDTSSVTNMNQMFYGCKSLTTLDLSSFDTSSVKNMQSMFAGTSDSNAMSLEKIYVSDSFVTTEVTSWEDMFKFDNSLEWWSGTRVSVALIYDSTYARIDEGPDSEKPWYFTEKIVQIEDSILLPWKDFNKIIKDLSNEWISDYLTRDDNIKAIKRNKDGLLSSDYRVVSIKGVINPVYVRYDSTDNTIYYYSDSDTIYMNADSSYMFYNLTALEEIDLDGFVTSNVETMESMFNACQSLEEIDVSNFDTSKVENMHAMFNACYSLTQLDVSNFNTENVTSMESMFSECQSLEEIDVSNFDTSKVENMRAMFNACRNLEEIDVSNFDTSKVENMQTMFFNCKNLITINLEGFDTSNVTNMKKMFGNLKNLTTIYASDEFATGNVTVADDMFLDDTKLMWWNWTRFNEENNSITYARIDTEWQSWYFTNKITIKIINIDDSNIIYTQTLNKWEMADISGLKKTWYTTSFYEDSWAIIWFDIEQPIMKYTEIYFNQSINKYTITFDTDWWSNINPITEDYETPITAPEDPVKDWYKFVWWDREIPITMPAEDITIKAKREKIDSGWWYSWWWGRWKKDTNSNIDSNDEKTESINKEYWTWEETQNRIWDNIDNGTCVGRWYSQEMCDTYKWAYNNGLTQYNNITDARFNSQINRQEMAKISSIFATKFFWKIPNVSKQEICSKFIDLDKVNFEMKQYILQSCELWYMWYKADWKETLERFRPYTPITLAEMAVTISRIIRWNKYAVSENNRYKWHLYAIYENNIIDSVNNPHRTATRWDVYNALYRLYQKHS